MARICRFDDDRLGIVEGEEVIDVTEALAVLPAVRWPLPPGDLLVAHLSEVLAAAQPLAATGRRLDRRSVRLLSPVANPGKIIGAPVNYLKHQAEAIADGGVNFERDVKTIAHYGLFLKAGSSLVGESEPIELAFPERRTDHEVELVAVIGRGGRDIPAHAALGHVAGYAIGLDMTVRGPEDRSLRKSLDTFSVLGPWLVTPDEIGDPGALAMRLEVNGAVRQQASTAELIFDVPRLIEYASAFYTLHPGDLIYTGTPEGVGAVAAGDRIDCAIDRIGTLSVTVA
ncbi:MAG: fumarylacetoacetate hydrolase family protein [Sphingomonas sp.]